jgi:adenylate cyclase
MENSDFEQYPIILNFKDKSFEREFSIFYELETRLFIRVGIILSLISWVTHTVLIYFFVSQHFSLLAPVILGCTLPFIFIVYATYKDTFVGHYQWMAAFANCVAGILMIFWIPYVGGKYSDHFILIGLIAVMFVGFYILRLRMIHSFIASLVFMTIFQGYLIFISELNLAQIMFLSYVTWTMEGFACFGGYVQESTNRRLYIQQITIKKQQEKIQLEHERAENLLLNILPSSIAERLKFGETVIADKFENISVLFADIVGFTRLSEKLSPEKLVQLLNKIFSIFDSLTEKYGLEKIKTIGDAYMVAGGLPIPQDNHGEAIADFALEMQQELACFNEKTSQAFDIRVGIHVGSAVAGVIGTKKFVYDIWGDTINTASRMESHGIPGQIHVSEQTFELLRDKYFFVERGIIDVKSKGKMRTFLLKRKKV